MLFRSLWPGSELGGSAKPDVQGSGCTSNCAAAPVVKSTLPGYAKNAHGNLADQSRTIGPSRGAVTLVALAAAAGSDKNEPTAQEIRAQAAPEKVASIASLPFDKIKPMLDANACTACHGIQNKLVGPSFKDITARYAGQSGAQALLAGKIKNGSQGVWGAIAMPAQALSAADATQIAQWLAAGMPDR